MLLFLCVTTAIACSTEDTAEAPSADAIVESDVVEVDDGAIDVLVDAAIDDVGGDTAVDASPKSCSMFLSLMRSWRFAFARFSDCE
jgi:hypothetical protein